MGYLNEDARALPGLMLESLTTADNYGRLARCFSGWQKEALNRMAREDKAQGTCIGGICALVMGERPQKQVPTPDTGAVNVRLKKSYARAMHLMSACEAFSADPEYGPVFQRLSIRQQDHCRKILEIIGSL